MGHTLPWGSRARASADRELAWAASRLFCCCPHPRWPPDGAMRGALGPAAPEAQPAPTSPSGSPAEPVVAPTPKGCPATPPPRTCSPPIGRFSPATPDSPLPATLSRPLPLHGPMYHPCKCGWDGVWPSLEPTAAAVSDGVASSTLCGAQPLPLAPFSRAFWYGPFPTMSR